MTTKFPAGVNHIFNQLQGGANLDTLKETNEVGVVNRALAGLAIFAPDFVDEKIGSPASEKNILMDQCVGFSLTETIHERIGRPHALQFVMPANTKDPEVYEFARENGYQAIVTADGADRTLDDLCAYAKSVANGDDPTLAADLPLIFVVSRNDEGMKQIQENTEKINEALQNRDSLIVDLRL